MAALAARRYAAALPPPPLPITPPPHPSVSFRARAAALVNARCLGLHSLPGGVRLVTWNGPHWLSSIEPCFDAQQ
jgi:hypothetical protein